MKLTAFLLGVGTSFAISLMAVLILIALNGRRNRGKFKCDMCGSRYPNIDDKFMVGDDMMCKSCYAAFMAPYKIEGENNR